MITETAYMEFIDYREQAEMAPGQGGSVAGRASDALKQGLTGSRQQQTETKVIAVQFQPSSLQFQAGAVRPARSRGDISKPEGGKQEKRENAEAAEPDNMTMSFNLIFDRSIYEDCDVAPEVEGLLAAVRNPFTRQASFNWGEMYYKGRVTGIQVSYEMFSKDGVPVRAKVSLTMKLEDTSESEK